VGALFAILASEVIRGQEWYDDAWAFF